MDAIRLNVVIGYWSCHSALLFALLRPSMEEYTMIFFPSSVIHKRSMDSSKEWHGCRWCPVLSHLHLGNNLITHWSVYFRKALLCSVNWKEASLVVDAIAGNSHVNWRNYAARNTSQWVHARGKVLSEQFSWRKPLALFNLRLLETFVLQLYPRSPCSVLAREDVSRQSWYAIV